MFGTGLGATKIAPHFAVGTNLHHVMQMVRSVLMFRRFTPENGLFVSIRIIDLWDE